MNELQKPFPKKSDTKIKKKTENQHKTQHVNQNSLAKVKFGLNK